MTQMRDWVKAKDKAIVKQAKAKTGKSKYEKQDEKPTLETNMKSILK